MTASNASVERLLDHVIATRGEGGAAPAQIQLKSGAMYSGSFRRCEVEGFYSMLAHFERQDGTAAPAEVFFAACEVVAVMVPTEIDMPAIVTPGGLGS